MEVNLKKAVGRGGVVLQINSIILPQKFGQLQIVNPQIFASLDELKWVLFSRPNCFF